jgi:hypothetical protein
MTKTKQVLSLLASGMPLDATAIAKETGWSKDLVWSILSHMKNSGHIKTTPVLYTITETGAKRLNVVSRPLTPAYARRKARAEEQANNRVGGRRGTAGHVLFIGHFGGSSSVSGARSPAMASVSKGGFGSIGARVGGGGG